jgi:cytidylate kinase
VLAGRDIGTVVLPDAECKIFLDATAEARAARRAEQRGFTLGSVEHQVILASLLARDAEDRARPVAPLVAADNAIVIHTDKLTLANVVQQVVAEARKVAR